MQQSLSELLADIHKQESEHQFAYPEINVCVCRFKQWLCPFMRHSQINCEIVIIWRRSTLATAPKIRSQSY